MSNFFPISLLTRFNDLLLLYKVYYWYLCFPFQVFNLSTLPLLVREGPGNKAKNTTNNIQILIQI